MLPFCLLFMASCGKDEDASDTQLPTISVISPTANQVFTGGQTVSVNAAITDNIRLKQIHLEIINNTTGNVVLHEHYPAAAATYSLTKNFTTQAATTYRIKVEADDAAGNVGRTELTVTAN